jgi:hypothetical protein
MIVPAKSMGMIRLRGGDDRSHAQQRNASRDAPRSAFGGNAGVTGCNLVLCAGTIKPCGDGRAPLKTAARRGTQSVPGCIPTRSMGTILEGRLAMIVPTLCVGMHPGTLRVPLLEVTQVSRGAILCCARERSSHAGMDVPPPKLRRDGGRRASRAAFPRRAWE